MFFEGSRIQTVARTLLMLGVIGLASACSKGSDNSSAAPSDSSAAATSSDNAASSSPAAYQPQAAQSQSHLMPVAMGTDQMAKAKSLAEAKGCFACHQVDAKVVGPAFAWVAYKYKGNPKAEATLAHAIQHGVQGVWGGMPMPAQNVTPAEAKELASWVLAQKPIAPPKAS